MQLMFVVMQTLLLWVTELELDVKKKKELSLGKLNLEMELQKILFHQSQQNLSLIHI